MSTSQIEIERHDNGSQGEYIAKLSGSEDKAELSWSDRNGVRHATHTFVLIEAPYACNSRHVRMLACA